MSMLDAVRPLISNAPVVVAVEHVKSSKEDVVTSFGSVTGLVGGVVNAFETAEFEE